MEPLYSSKLLYKKIILLGIFIWKSFCTNFENVQIVKASQDRSRELSKYLFFLDVKVWSIPHKTSICEGQIFIIYLWCKGSLFCPSYDIYSPIFRVSNVCFIVEEVRLWLIQVKLEFYSNVIGPKSHILLCSDLSSIIHVSFPMRAQMCNTLNMSKNNISGTCNVVNLYTQMAVIHLFLKIRKADQG